MNLFTGEDERKRKERKGKGITIIRDGHDRDDSAASGGTAGIGEAESSFSAGVEVCSAGTSVGILLSIVTKRVAELRHRHTSTRA